jgi:NTP pyrophosphatase (non-canonical NTP hydrolase)
MRDRETTINELKERVRQFCEERDWDQFHNAKDLAIAISTEASELLEHFRFRKEKEIEEIIESKQKKQLLSEEIADIFYFLLRFAQKYDIDISKELLEKIEKNEKRYPVHKAKGSNKKYSEL